MRFSFRRPSAATTATEELPPPAEKPREEEARPGAQLENDAREERIPAGLSFTPQAELVSATQLPSAAAALAELFPEEAAGTGTAPRATESIPTAGTRSIGLSLFPSLAKAVRGGTAVLDREETVQAAQEEPQVTTKTATAPADAKPFRENPAAAKAREVPTPTVERVFGPLEAEREPAPRQAEVAVLSAPKQEDSTISFEDAATVVAAASAELDAEEAAQQLREGLQQDQADSPGLPPPITLPISSSNWAFEETLASHREWIESKGVSGRKADLANAHLDGAELISVNLRLADLHYANLRGTDLLLADLRDACLVRSDLEECCLVGANLEGANLEGASMETALGLVPRQLAGANLREATLPAQIAQFPAEETFRTASRSAVRFFWTTMALSAISWLAIWKTKDVQLVTDSAILPFLHSRTAAAAMPTAEIFLIAPVLIFLLYVAFIAKLQRLWGAVLELPAVFPDGRSLGEKEPPILVGLLRAHFRWMSLDPPSGRVLEAALCQLLAYWVVPVTLILYWARYLTLQEIHGTILQEVLAAVATGIALHATFKVGRPQERWAVQRTFSNAVAEKLRTVRPPVFAGIILGVTTFLSFGTLAGIPHDRSRAPQFGAMNIRRWAPSVLWTLGYDPYANLTEGSFSTPPAGWNGATDPITHVRGIRLDNPRFRYAQAYGAFLVNSRLLHADFRGAYLSNADFRGADLTQSNLEFAIMDSAQVNNANLDRAILDGTHLARADFRDANLSYAYLANSFLVDARFDGASLYNASLSHCTMVRGSFQRADLRNAHLDASNLEHADFTQAYLWSAGLEGADLKSAQLGTAILIGANLRGTNLGGAHFAGTVLNDTDLTGANLDGADLRGAFGLTAYQVCTASSHTGALFDDAMQPQVEAKCGGGH